MEKDAEKERERGKRGRLLCILKVLSIATFMQMGECVRTVGNAIGVVLALEHF